MYLHSVKPCSIKHGNDRNMITSEMGQKNDGPNEKTWKVYVRRKKETKSEGKNGKGKESWLDMSARREEI